VASPRSCEFEHTGFEQELSYGYQWRVLSGDKNGFTALGKGGQFIHIFPEMDTVVVQHGDWDGFSRDEISNSLCESFVVHRLLSEYGW
tara:strand:- start:4772 stop:5035 length:264 start_codon:yes stop_codon:yes gene_type:complete